MKLIDKDALVAEIERRIKGTNNDIKIGAIESLVVSKTLYRLISFIDTLEVKEIGVDLGDPKGDKSAKYIIDTKTLEVKEVDLEKELQLFFYPHVPWGDYCKNEQKDIKEWSFKIARHFFELGLNTQHSSINIPNIDDILKEEGIDPFSKEAKILKESYYTALDKFKAKKGEEV